MFYTYISVYTHPHNTSLLPRTFYQELHPLFFFSSVKKQQKTKHSAQRQNYPPQSPDRMVCRPVLKINKEMKK